MQKLCFAMVVHNIFLRKQIGQIYIHMKGKHKRITDTRLLVVPV